VAILIPIFLVAFASVIAVVSFTTSYFRSRQGQQIRSMLRSAEAAPGELHSTNLLNEKKVENGITKLLKRFSFGDRLDLVIEQSGQKTTSSKVVLFSLIAMAIGFIVGSRFSVLPGGLCGVIGALFGASLPMLRLLRKRSRNIEEFEKQFPEALDFLSRSMRAGHGFSIAMELLASDSPDPLGSAFRRISNDMQLGSALDLALAKLCAAMPLIDVRFFASSILLQQETGGNLSEILGKLAIIIRERFRLKGQVKAVSAHGRITGLVLVLMPVAVAAIMMVTTPQYLIDLAADKLGRMMIYGAVCGQIVGYFVIQKIINIKV
jgi:tight adherence protein B